MKIKNSLIAVLALLAFSISACKKNTIDDPTPTNIIAEDSVYLSRYYYVDKFFGGIDTGTKRTYLFDNLKRVTNINDTSFEGGATNPPISFTKIQYFYNGRDSLPYKRINIFKTLRLGILKSNDTITNFYSFNANGKLILDSAIKSSDGFYNQSNNTYTRSISKRVQLLNYSGNKVYGLQQFSYLQNLNGTQNPYIRKDTATLSTLGNISSSSYRKDNLSPGSGFSYHTTTFTYDNKYSPFYKMNVKYASNIFDLDINNSGSFSNFDFVPYNNILQTQDISFGSSSTTPYIDFNDNTGAYTYKQNGFLSSFFFDYGSSVISSKGIFIYKAL
jgi:hypothetical protein